MTKIGIAKEFKIPIDKRVPVTPSQAKKIQSIFDDTNIVVQSSDIRCFSDQDYIKEGIEIVEDLRDCDIILGIKEVPVKKLISNKTYLFFSHTTKKQEYNRSLIKAILKEKIQLVDYEMLTDKENNRIIAFGRWAGIVGAYNGIWAFGKRNQLFNIRRAYQCFDLKDLRSEFPNIKLPPIKIVITGGGRVAKGAIEMLDGLDIKKVTPHSFLYDEFNEPVFTQLKSKDYNLHKNNSEFNRKEFHKSPEKYKGDFLKYTSVADLLIACAYWHPKSPVLFTREDIINKNFKTKIIADITCDINGSIPTTIQPSNIEKPIYDFNPVKNNVEPLFSNQQNITVMAVDNLPGELPRDASRSFGLELIENVLPHLLGEDSNGIIERATITKNGVLTDNFRYLSEYAGVTNVQVLDY